MKVKKLIEQLSALPQDSEIFWADFYGTDKNDGLPIYGLYDYDDVEIKHMDRLRSARSMLPSSNSVVENVIIIER